MSNIYIFKVAQKIDGIVRYVIDDLEIDDIPLNVCVTIRTRKKEIKIINSEVKAVA